MAESAAFISYSRQDVFFAKRVRAELIQFGLPTFQDLESIEPGERFRDQIATGLKSSRCMVLLVSKNSLGSDEVMAEIEIAKANAVPILPVILDDQAVAEPNRVLDVIADLQWIYLSAGKGKSIDVSPVVRAVRRRWQPTAPVIAFSNLKGGVGKTTLAAHLSSSLSYKANLSILVIDMDPQANLSQFVLPQSRLAELISNDKSVLSLFEKSLIYNSQSPSDTLFSVSTEIITEPEIFDVSSEVEFSELAKKINGNRRKPVYLIPGQFELVKYTLPRNAHALEIVKANFARSIAAARKEFDVILIDLNPSSSFMIECALTAATHVVCPIRPDKYSVQGLHGLRALIDKAFGLSKPPEILPIFNGVPGWDPQMVSRIQSVIHQPEKVERLASERKIRNAVFAIAEVLRNSDKFSSIISVPIPDTTMLKAYHEAKSGGFFSLSRFERSGSYGARLANRLMDVADQIIAKTKADSLSEYHSTSATKATQTNA